MEDDTVVFLAGAGEESGHVDEGHDGDVERVAEAHEAGALAGGVGVEHAGEHLGLVGHDADRTSVEAGEADDYVAGVVALDFKEFAVVNDCADDLIHVVGTVGAFGHDFVEQVLGAVDRVVAFGGGGILQVVAGDVAEELAHNLDGLLAVFSGKVGHAALGGVHACASEVFLADIFSGHGLHNLRAGEEHVADSLGHDGEVGEGRRVDGSSGAGAEDGGNLGNHA